MNSRLVLSGLFALSAACGNVDNRPLRPDVVLDVNRPEFSNPDASSLPPEAGMDSGPDAAPEADLPESSTGDASEGGPLLDAPGACMPLRELLATGETVRGTLAGPDRIHTAPCGAPASPIPTGGPEDVYSFQLAQPSVVHFQTRNSTLNTVVSVRRACGDLSTEVACNNDRPGDTSGLSELSVRLEPGRYEVIVDQLGDAPLVPGGRYDLDFDVASAAPNGSCASATPLASGAPQTGVVGSATASTPCNAPPGQYLYYAVTVPPGQAATITATPAASAQLTMVTLGGCMDATCADVSSSSGGGRAVERNEYNLGGSPSTRIVAVGSADPSARFTVGLTLGAVPANGQCTNALTLSGDVVRTDGFDRAGTARSGVCGAGFAGSSLFYRTTVPPGYSLAVTAQPQDAEDAFVRLFSACDATTCLASSDSAGASGRESVTYVNSGSAPQAVLLEVGNTAGASGAVNLYEQLDVTPPNGTCAGLPTVALNPGAPLLRQASLLAPSSTACGGAASQLYYRLTVPARNHATVTVDPQSPYELVTASVQQNCAATACVAQGTGAGMPAVLDFDNNTDGTQQYVVAASGTQPFAISAALRAPTLPYVTSRVPVACADLDSPSVVDSGLLVVDGDDVLGPAVPLPFAFRYWGLDVSHFEVSSNGFLALHNAAGVSIGDSFYMNTQLPNPMPANGVVAPFWDDLLPSADPSASPTVRWGTIGAAPTRSLVVEWRDRALYGAAPSTVRLTFQAHLREGTNAIEFHYCRADSPPELVNLVQGGSATVGIESLDGAMGVQASFNSLVDQLLLSGIRFVPGT